MAGESKNNPSNRKTGTSKGKMVTSFDCEACKNQCPKGKNYLKNFKNRLEGKGVMCNNM